MELGGFAENPKEIDGDFNAFNYCLAENYLNAFYMEDFDSIGDIDTSFFDNICYWLDYDGRHRNEDAINDLKSGNMITTKNRTIIDAIYKNRVFSLASIYLDKNIFSPKIILTLLLDEEDQIIRIVNYDLNKEEYNNIFKELFYLIELECDKIKRKKEFLEKIKSNISRIRCNKDYDIKTISKKYKWIKELRKDNDYAKKI